MKNQSRAYLYALLTIFLWSTVATAFKIALANLNYIQLLLIANFTSLIVFFGILLIQKKFLLITLQLSESTGKVANMIYLTPFISLVIISFCSA